MPAKKLTQRFCETAPLETPAVFYSDTTTSGLALKCSKTKRSFYFYKKVAGKPVKRFIGDVGPWDLKEARDEAIKVAQEVVSKGGAKTKKDKSRTFGDLAAIYIRVKRDGGTKTDLWAKNCTKSLHNVKLIDLTRGDIEEYYAKESKRTSDSTANRVLSFIKAVVNFGYDNNYIDDLRPARVKKRTVEGRSRALTLDELRTFYRNLENCRSVHSKTVLKMLCLTGLRISEVLKIEKKKQKFDREFVLAKTKTKAQRSVVVADAVAQLLNDYCTQFDVKPGEKVFKIKSVRKPFARITELSGISDFTIHDIRRTFATVQVELGAGIQTVAANLGHGKTASVIDIYVRARKRDQREAYDKLHDELIEKY